jgi:hypothetical protein
VDLGGEALMKIHVESVRRTEMVDGAGGRHPSWLVAKVLTHDDGRSERQAMFFPPDTLEWRAAEYGIDHTDIDTLLKIVLYEPHLDPLEQPDHVHPMTLHNAPSVRHAREFHLQRVADAAARHPVTVAAHPSMADRDVLHEIRTHSPLHPSVIAAKAAFIAQARDTERGRRLLNTVEPHHTELPEAERLAHLHRTMNPRHEHYGAVDG